MIPPLSGRYVHARAGERAVRFLVLVPRQIQFCGCFGAATGFLALATDPNIRKIGFDEVPVQSLRIALQVLILFCYSSLFVFHFSGGPLCPLLSALQWIHTKQSFSINFSVPVALERTFKPEPKSFTVPPRGSAIARFRHNMGSRSIASAPERLPFLKYSATETTQKPVLVKRQGFCSKVLYPFVGFDFQAPSINVRCSGESFFVWSHFLFC